MKGIIEETTEEWHQPLDLTPGKIHYVPKDELKGWKIPGPGVGIRFGIDHAEPGSDHTVEAVWYKGRFFPMHMTADEADAREQSWRKRVDAEVTEIYAALEEALIAPAIARIREILKGKGISRDSDYENFTHGPQEGEPMDKAENFTSLDGRTYPRPPQGIKVKDHMAQTQPVDERLLPDLEQTIGETAYFSPPSEIQMPLWQCHKQVLALEIERAVTLFGDDIEYLPAISANGGRVAFSIEIHFTDPRFLPKKVTADVTNRHWPNKGDFFVVYLGDEGYQSISPRQAFLEGYTLLEC